jgi:hypothetical protein
LANPTRLEAQYERIEGWWTKLPLVRSSVRLQQFPFVVVMLALFVGSLSLILGLAAVLGADRSHGATTALVLISWVMLFFALVMVLVIRATQRAARKDNG